MKLKFLTLIAFAVLSQDAVCQTNTGPSSSSLTDGCYNSLYSDSVFINFNSDTIFAGFIIPIDSGLVTSVSNLPVGITASCLPQNCTSINSGSGINPIQLNFEGMPTSLLNNHPIEVVYSHWCTIFGSTQHYVDTSTIYMTVNGVSDITTTVNDLIISANATNSSYQWIDCSNNSVLPGETNQTFVASANGSYAVEITENGCVDTSLCVIINNVSLDEVNINFEPKIYPLPSSGELSIELPEKLNHISVELRDLQGRCSIRKNYFDVNFIKLNIKEPAGTYFLTLEAEMTKRTLKILIN